MGKVKGEVIKLQNTTIMDNERPLDVYVADSSWKGCQFRGSPCCVYSGEENFYLCPFVGEEILVNGGKETGLATIDCGIDANQF